MVYNNEIFSIITTVEPNHRKVKSWIILCGIGNYVSNTNIIKNNNFYLRKKT